MWQYWGMRVAQRLAATLPNPAQYRLAVLVGELIFHLWRDKSRATLENAAQVLNLPPGDRRVRTVARQCFHNYAKYLVEFFQLPFRTSADLQAKVSQLIGWEHIEAALARGQGVIYVTAHFGNWDVGGSVVAARHPMSVVAETFQPARLDALVRETRTAHGMATIPLENALRKVLRALRRNEVVALVIDRPVHEQEGGVPVRLFGRDTRWPGGAAALAMKTDALVLAGGCWRNPDNTYSIMAAAPIRCETTGDRDGDLRRNMQRIVDALEQIIRRHPDQWYMFRRMWPVPAASRT